MLHQLEMPRGKGGINMDLEIMMFTVTGYEVLQQRTIPISDDPSIPDETSTTTELRLSLHATPSHSRPINLALVTFGEPSVRDSHQIGQITKQDDDSGKFELDVYLPAADFDNYWKILTHERRPHLRCVISSIGGVEIVEFTLASAFPVSHHGPSK